MKIMHRCILSFQGRNNIKSGALVARRKTSFVEAHKATQTPSLPNTYTMRDVRK